MLERFKFEIFIIINLLNLIIKLFINDSKIFNRVYFIILYKLIFIKENNINKNDIFSERESSAIKRKKLI